MNSELAFAVENKSIYDVIDIIAPHRITNIVRESTLDQKVINKVKGHDNNITITDDEAHKL